MILFGPSGNQDRFYEEGHKSSLDAPKWLNSLGLTAYEYICARGVNIGKDMAMRLGDEAAKYGIALSIHAPFYINLASNDEDIIKRSFVYIKDTCSAARYMGADRIVIHPGSVGKDTREEAFKRLKKNFKKIAEECFELYPSVSLSPETMGKRNQIGNLEETIELCELVDTMIPTIDFAHLHALGSGSLNNKKDFDDIFDKVNKLKRKHIHMHYSRVEFTEKGGEKRHLSLSDFPNGPDFGPLAKSIVTNDINGTIICESRDTMADDAVSMKNMFNKIKKDSKKDAE